MKNQKSVVEYSLVAGKFKWEIAPGKIIDAWGFNQQLPGPVLKAKAGDTLVVRLMNTLEEPVTIHWHGVRLPALMDGTADVQKPIYPGEEFEYRFEVPDAGTFWYHSHVNETTQMERGLYGALVVTGDNEPVTDGERVLMFDDMKLTGKNDFAKPRWFFTRFMERHDGRQGKTLLFNGKQRPTIEMNGGQVERWRVVNASSARYVKLYMGGKPFRLIGTDGGLLEKPVTMTQLLLSPGERAELTTGPFQEGEQIGLESLAYNRRTFVKSKRELFATIKVLGNKASVAAIPDELRRIEALAPQYAIPNRKIKFSIGPSLKRGIDFLVNNKMHSNDRPVLSGELQVWEIRNTSLMDHPFHLHGDFFQVIEENGKAPSYKAWKDTVNLGPLSKVKIAWLPGDRTGTWMYHCHILEHHEAGMMANFEVLGANEFASRSSAGELVTHAVHHHQTY